MFKNMMKNVTNSVKNRVGIAGLYAKKYSPEISLTVGIVGCVGTVVLACKETLSAESILDAHNERLNNIQQAVEIASEDREVVYTDKDIARDRLICYSRLAVDFAKLYAPSIILGTVSIGMILYSHSTMKKRYLGVLAAYNAISEAFHSYRERVIEAEGSDKDREYLCGIKNETIEKTIVDGKGKEKTVTEQIKTANGAPSAYARWFCQGVSTWQSDNGLNRLFLEATEKAFNHTLQTRGYVWLNEVYEALGFSQTPEGAVTGWVKDNKDGYIDFGLYEPNDNSRTFINGNSNSILLDFNVDGIILDMIPSRDQFDESINQK